MKTPLPIQKGLLTTEQLLLAGGDLRLALDPVSGLNKYGCKPYPDASILAFGSSTASIVSRAGFAAANALRQKLLLAIDNAEPVTVYAEEMQRIETEWRELCGLSAFKELALVFSPSGTDIHSIATRYASGSFDNPALAVMVETNETGSGVLSALHEHAATGKTSVDVVQVAIRQVDGSLRPLSAIDVEVEREVDQAASVGRRVLLILVDQTKTGLIAPSPACVVSLKQRYPKHVEVLVDACQFRIAIPTLHAYLKQGFMVALTGSKFLTGPSFSGVLMLPENIKHHRQASANLPCAKGGEVLIDRRKPIANFGLLLRFEAALEELRRFRAAPEAKVVSFVQAFETAIQQRLAADPHFEPIAVRPLDRFPVTNADSWDQVQTIFPFLLCFPNAPRGRKYLNQAQTIAIYQHLPLEFNHKDHDTAIVRCQVGQPVGCGVREGVPLHALRLCLSARLVVEATQQSGQDTKIIKDALKVLDKIALLIHAAERHEQNVAQLIEMA